ncbi:class I SAM-dependent methyltransferase [Halomonadaceae bacterium KBTZ08]
MELDHVVPWGRSFPEYQRMFNLAPADLDKRILGCGDGPASFNATVTGRGGRVVSCDPVYQFSADAIRRRIETVYPEILAKVSANASNYLWEDLQTVEELGQVRWEAMMAFLSDFPEGHAQGRYRAVSLPELPFEDSAFDLALCSHYLFLYSDHLDTEGHLQGMRELCRVADEVRVFPLVSLDGHRSRHLDAVMEALVSEGCQVALEPVDYRFQKGATDMLVVKA